MKILKYGSRGASVSLLQLALNRAEVSTLSTDGIFGAKTKQALMSFQAKNGLAADGIAGPATHRALMPYYTGFAVHRVFRGDTLWSIAALYKSTLAAILTANPSLDSANLRIGSSVIVPLPFDVVPTTIDYSSALVGYCVRGLAARYPILGIGEYGKSVLGRPLWYLELGRGDNLVLYNAEHHANEWITTPILLKFAEDCLKAQTEGRSIFGVPASELLKIASIYLAPCVNPDGLDLVTGDLGDSAALSTAEKIAANYPDIPFPLGWKANIRGIDLNLQYPADWETARKNKFAQGYISPAPQDYVGTAPLAAAEARALYDFTLSLSPRLILAYHTQGEIIYWKFKDFEPKNSRKIAEELSAVSGYAYEETPYASGFAGYKDWFIQDFDRPGYTVEAGLGVNPLPISQFDSIYAKNLGILVTAARLAD